MRFHGAVRAAGVPVVFTRFTVPAGEGDLVRNTEFMKAVGDSQEDLGFIVHPVSDCVAAASDAVHAASVANLDLTTAGCLTAEEVRALLR